jgi:membrane protein
MGDLLSSFVQESTTLVSQEMELARAEIGEQVTRAGKGASLFAAAAVLALAGLGALTACAVVALALAMDTWIAALIVGGALLLLAGALALMGRARLKAVAPPVPERALRGVRRDIEAVQEGVQSGRSTNGEESHGA